MAYFAKALVTDRWPLPQPVTVEVFNGAGELVWSAAGIAGAATGVALSEGAFLPTAAGPGLKLKTRWTLADID